VTVGAVVLEEGFAHRHITAHGQLVGSDEDAVVFRLVGDEEARSVRDWSSSTAEKSWSGLVAPLSAPRTKVAP